MSATVLDQAPPAPSGTAAPEQSQTPHKLDLQFTGRTDEYCWIWLRDTLLTIVTLGFYSPWAKIRRMRWFLGHTRLDGSGLDYHAKPWPMLIGRVIALLLMASPQILGAVDPKFAFAGVLLILIAMPWLIARSIRFRAAKTSWRNVRFRFVGGYWGAVANYVLRPLLIPLTLGCLAPTVMARQSYYLFQNLSFGNKPFAGKIPRAEFKRIARPFWITCLVSMLAYLGFALLVVLAVGGVFAGLFMNSGQIGEGQKTLVLTTGVALVVFLYLAVVAFFGFLPIVAWILVRRAQFDALSLGGEGEFRFTASPYRYLGILITNWLLMLVSLGLLYPYTAVRRWRYLVAHTTIGGLDPDYFVGLQPDQVSSFGDEAAEAMSIDISL